MNVKTSDPLLKYYRKQTDLFLEYHKLLSEKAEVENIHKLRLCIKKIRAVYRLIQELTSPEKFDAKKHYALFLPIFESSGILRETHVNKDIVRKYEFSSAVEAYRSELDNRIQQSLMSLPQALASFDVKSFEQSRESIGLLIGKLKKKDIVATCASLLEKRIAKISKLYAHSHKASHKIRKHLKDMAIITKILRKYDDDKKLKRLAKNIRSGEQMIGDWHNLQVLSRSISRFGKKNHSIVITGLEEVLLKDSEEALQGIARFLKKLD